MGRINEQTITDKLNWVSKPGQSFNYPQKDNFNSATFMDATGRIKDLRNSAEIVASIYAMSQANKICGRDNDNQADYISIENSFFNSVVQSDFFPYREAYRQISADLNNMSAYAFLMEHHAYRLMSKDNSGVENGFLYESFFSRVKKDDVAVLVDPTPAFLDQVHRDSRYNDIKIIVCHSDERICAICQCNPDWKRFQFASPDQIKVDSGMVHVLIFGDLLSQAKITEFMSAIREQDTADRFVYYLYIPNTFFEGKEGRRLLHPYLVSEYALQAVQVIDANAFHYIKRKHSVLVLRPKSFQQEDFLLQRIQFNKKADSITLMSSEVFGAEFELFRDGNTTLSSVLLNAEKKAYTERTQVSKRKSPAEPILITFSNEIVGYGSVSATPNGKCRFQLTIYQKPTARQKRENYKGRGTPVHKPLKGKTYRSKQEAIQHAYEILLENDSLGRAVRDMLNMQFDAVSLSVKSFWFLHLDQIKQNKRYDHQFAVKAFCESNKHLKFIRNISIRDFTEAKATEIKARLATSNCSDNEISNILYLLFVICDVAKQEKLLPNNPCTIAVQDDREAIQRIDKH